MQHYYWNEWYSGWGWFLWFGLVFVMFSSFGNWGYTYTASRRLNGIKQKDALDFLNERYARGEINHEEYNKVKSHIFDKNNSTTSNQKNINQSSGTLKPIY